MSYVIDASALLAVINQETGADAVIPFLRQSLVSAVNLSEVYTKLFDKGIDADLADAQVKRLELNIEPFGESLAFQAAGLRLSTRHLGLSFGDRVCLAQAQLSNLPVLTADKEWAKLDIGIEIRLIR
jgi:ribonuclease VapC